MQKAKRGFAFWYAGLTFILIGIVVGVAASILPETDPVGAYGEPFLTGIASLGLWLIGIVMILVAVFHRN